MMPDLSDITVAILAGGAGKRLRPVVFGRPKVLAEVSNRPFLEILLDQLDSAGFQNIVICTGYLGGQIKKTFGNKYKKLNLLYSHEQLPLGTAGALRLALPLLRSQMVLVMNGDSFCAVNFKKLLKFHLDKKAGATLTVSYSREIYRFGKIKLDSTNRIVGFEEKQTEDAQGWINAGIYLLRHSLISGISEGKKISLERQIFPKLVGHKFYGYRHDGRFLDIGVPDSYKEVGSFFAKRFVLLDRDGTIIVKKNYLSDPDGVRLIPGVLKALNKLQEMGLGLVVITNQSGIGRGYFDIATLENIHLRMAGLLAKGGVILDDIYFCPHMPEDNCPCRKPKAGLVEKAGKKHNFDPKLCFMIGDNKGDIELGKNIGAKTILVRTGCGRQAEKEVSPDYVVDNLNDVLPVIRSELLPV